MIFSWTKTTLLTLGLCSASITFAQTPTPTHQHIGCGTSIESQYDTRDRMFRNRENQAELLSRVQQRNGLLYIPIQFHLVGTSSGQSHHPIEEVYAVLCRINEDVESVGMNIRFYMHDNVRYHNNDLLFDHSSESSDFTAQYIMSLYKVPGVVNIFIGRQGQQGDTFGAYYTSLIDVIYTFKGDVNANSSALTHELGHYFTLAHTFFGWENDDYFNIETLGKAPLQVGGVLVEKVSRPGSGPYPENCQAAADGFCDTPADYTKGYSSCNFTATNYFDPDSLPIAPQENNIMSYFPRFCMENLTADQQTAMMVDIASRGYDLFPALDDTLVTSAPTLEWPTASAPALYYNLLELRWTAATGATRYLVTVQKYFNGGVIGEPIQMETTNTSAWVSLEANTTYQWTVKPLNGIDVCNNFTSTPEIFDTKDWELSIDETNVASLNSSSIYPNPSGIGQDVILEINVDAPTQATISIQNSLGQMIMSPQPIDLVQGNNTQQISTMGLNAGMYLVYIETGNERICHKLMLEE